MTVHVPLKINVNLNYNQVRHMESFTLYLKGYERFEMSRRLGHEDGFDRPAIRIQTSLEQVENGEVSEKKKRTIVSFLVFWFFFFSHTTECTPNFLSLFFDAIPPPPLFWRRSTIASPRKRLNFISQ